jgi:MFS superfamily sulfate permease-like transporter
LFRIDNGTPNFQVRAQNFVSGVESEIPLKNLTNFSDVLRFTVVHLFLLSRSPFRDLLSGVIMAATSVPQLIAYAETVGYAGESEMNTSILRMT